MPSHPCRTPAPTRMHEKRRTHSKAKHAHRFQPDSRWLSAQTKHGTAWLSSLARDERLRGETSANLRACALALPLHLFRLTDAADGMFKISMGYISHGHLGYMNKFWKLKAPLYNIFKVDWTNYVSHSKRANKNSSLPVEPICKSATHLIAPAPSPSKGFWLVRSYFDRLKTYQTEAFQDGSERFLDLKSQRSSSLARFSILHNIDYTTSEHSSSITASRFWIYPILMTVAVQDEKPPTLKRLYRPNVVLEKDPVVSLWKMPLMSKLRIPHNPVLLIAQTSVTSRPLKSSFHYTSPVTV